MDAVSRRSKEDVDRNSKQHRKSGMPPTNVFKAGSLGSSPPVAQPQEAAHSAPVDRRFAFDPKTGGMRKLTSAEMDRAAYVPQPGDAINPALSATHSQRNVDAHQASVRDIGRPNYAPNTRRISLNTLPQQAARHPASAVADTAIASSGSSGPRPAPSPRYTSSFAGRTRRPTSLNSQTGRSGDSGSGSGESHQAAAAKSGEIDDDTSALQAFIGDLESASVRSHALMRQPTGAHTVDLAKFRGLAVSSLADDMASSLTLGSSGTPPSRRLSNVPGLSTTSSSPGHVPYVRSRLSAQSVTGTKPEEEGAEDEDEDEDEPCFFPAEDVQ